jgi:hypothetical protein
MIEVANKGKPQVDRCSFSVNYSTPLTLRHTAIPAVTLKCNQCVTLLMQHGLLQLCQQHNSKH